MAETQQKQLENLRIPDDQILKLYQNQAKKLHSALMQKGVDEQYIIEIILHHNWIQRLGILSAYQKLYKNENDNFNDLVVKKLSKDFQLIVKSSFVDRYELWADLITKTLGEKKRNIQQLICLIVLQNDNDTTRINTYLQKPQDQLLIEKLNEDEKKQKYYQLLLNILQQQNQKNYKVEQAVQQLKKSAEGFGCNEETFIDILTSSSYSNIKKINDQLVSENSTSIVQLVDKEFTQKNAKETHFAFLVLAHYMLDPPSALAKAMKESKNNQLDIYLTVLFSDYMKDELVEKYKQFGDFNKDTKSQFSGNTKILVGGMWGASE